MQVTAPAGAFCGWRMNARRRISPAWMSPIRRKPRVICQTELPHRNVRSNSLEVCGDMMAVAYQTSTHGATPAGIELFDISNPEAPRGIGFFDCSGPASRGVHQLWFIDGKTMYCAGGAPDFTPRNLLDDQPFRAIDVSDPTKPREIGRWWYPGSPRAMTAPPPPRHPQIQHRLACAQHQRLSGTAGSRVSRLYRWRRDHSRYRRYQRAEDGRALESASAVPRLHPYRDAAVRPRPAGVQRRMRARRRARTGRSWSGCWTRGWRAISSASRRCRCRRSRNTRSAAAVMARITCTRTGPARRSIPDTLVFGTYFSGGCGCTTSPIRSSRRRSRLIVPEAPAGSRGRRGSDQRCLRRRESAGLRGRSFRWRAVRHGDDGVANARLPRFLGQLALGRISESMPSPWPLTQGRNSRRQSNDVNTHFTD